MLVHLRWAIVQKTCMYAARIHLQWANVLIEEPKEVPEGLQTPPLVFDPLLDPLVVSKSLDITKKHKFFAIRTLLPGPLVAK